MERFFAWLTGGFRRPALRGKTSINLPRLHTTSKHHILKSFETSSFLILYHNRLKQPLKISDFTLFFSIPLTEEENEKAERDNRKSSKRKEKSEFLKTLNHTP